MSLTGVREELAEALSTVDGVTGYQKPPKAPKTGDAWPRLAQLERDAISGQYTVTWRVLVLLPTDETVALEQLETLAPALDDALTGLGYVSTYTPVIYQAGSNATYPALEATLIRE